MTIISSPIATKKHVGPRIPFMLQHLPRVHQDLPDLLHELVQQYGNVVRLPLGPRPVFLVASPKGVEHVLQNNQHNYQGWDYSHVQLRQLLGNGLLTSEGETWLNHRRLAQQAFHNGQLEKLSRIMEMTIKNSLDQLEIRVATTATLDIGREMGLMTLRIVTESLFGTNMGEWAIRIRDAWPLVLDHIARRLINPLPLPGQLYANGNRQYQKSLAILNDAINMLISTHRAATKENETLLGMLIAAHDQKLDIKLDNEELRDEIMTIMLAGHETCANALTWMFYLLAQNPDIQERVAEEASVTLAGQAPGYTDLIRLSYTAMVFNETLRLYPPAWVMARDTLHDDVIEGWNVPAGSLVFLSPYVTHRLDEYWFEPLNFNPLHFSLENSSDRPRFAYFPFGGGQRQCLGKNFALLEAQLIIPMLVQKYRFSLEESLESGWGNRANIRYPTYNMRPQKPIYINLEKR